MSSGILYSIAPVLRGISMPMPLMHNAAAWVYAECRPDRLLQRLRECYYPKPHPLLDRNISVATYLHPDSKPEPLI